MGEKCCGECKCLEEDNDDESVVGYCSFDNERVFHSDERTCFEPKEVLRDD